MNNADACHDINDVTRLIVTGCRGAYRVETLAPVAPGLSILAPRYEGGYWTFRPRIDIPAVALGDVVRIVPKAGSVRLMRVARVGHDIITMTEIRTGDEG